MICYVLIVSEFFPKNHLKAGYPTGFPESIINGKKIHTIRGNYDLWEKRFKKVHEGKAYISLRKWTGKPYKSTQVEIKKFYNTDGIGIEKLEDPRIFVFAPINGIKVYWDLLAKNDGLSFNDFREWFKNIDISPMAVIHFTDFRYVK